MRWIFLFILAIFIFVTPAHAVSLNLQGTTDNISFDSEFPVQISLSINSADGTGYFLRGVFYKEGTTNYCGLTWNGNSWFAGPYSTNEGWKNFLPITINNASWSGLLKAKIDTNDTGCQSSGTYKFKIERFTNSGSGSYDSQNELSVNISVPTPTFTPTPSPKPSPTFTPTPTSKPSPTPIKSGSTLAPAKSNTPVPTIKTPVVAQETVSIHTVTPSTKAQQQKAVGKVLAADTSSNPPSPSPTKIPENKKSGFSFWLVFVVLGFSILASGCGILLYQEWKKRKGEDI